MRSVSIETLARRQMLANRRKDFLSSLAVWFGHLICESARHCSRNVRGAIGGASRQAVQAPIGGAIRAINPLTFPILPCLTTSLWANRARSEEHTSELQSHSFISYAVFCLKK